jgi:hypothetical protein
MNAVNIVRSTLVLACRGSLKGAAGGANAPPAGLVEVIWWFQTLSRLARVH